MELETLRIPQIISVSRRTDIPAWHAEEFVRCLKAGEVMVKAPYSGDSRRVSLRPEDVLGFVFWSKNFKPLLPHLDRIEAVSPNLYFHFTITGAPASLEPHSPPVEDAVKDFIRLSTRNSGAQVMWRFDPLCITGDYPFEKHLDNFKRIAGRLVGNAQGCTISFVQPYAEVLARFKAGSSHVFLDLSEGQKRDHAGDLARVAGGFGIQLHACCNDFLVSEKIEKAHCIDKNRLTDIWKVPMNDPEAYAPTRKGCGCTRSLDIGAYDTCPGGCLYCYANSSKQVIRLKSEAGREA